MVIASFISSIFNILMALMSSAVFWILHRNQADVPFTITLKWNQRNAAIASTTKSPPKMDPFSQCGRRKKLAKLLSKIPVKGELLKFEILSSTEQSSGCLLSGVFVSEQSIGAESEDDLFSEFMGKYGDIKDSVMEAFKLNNFTNDFHFDISIARSSKTSPEKRLKLAVETMRYFNVPDDMVVTVQRQMKSASMERRSTEVLAKEGGVGMSGGTTVKSYSLCFIAAQCSQCKSNHFHFTTESAHCGATEWE